MVVRVELRLFMACIEWIGEGREGPIRHKLSFREQDTDKHEDEHSLKPYKVAQETCTDQEPDKVLTFVYIVHLSTPFIDTFNDKQTQILTSYPLIRDNLAC